MPEQPRTAEGWYALHDFRTVDWDAWRTAAAEERDRAIEEGVAYLDAHTALEDADEGATAAFSVVGHKADLLVMHLRPTVAALEAAERRLDRTALAGYLDQPASYLSVTEASGYSERAREYLDGANDDAGLANYIDSRLYPDLPGAEHVCFYPMDKRRDPEYNWYDLPFEERADLMAGHGDIGREYAERVTQIITGSVGLDDHEWGVTLFADDPTAVKELLYEMRFDPSTSRYAEFGTFYFGRRFAPEHLDRLFAGEAVPAFDERRSGSDTGLADRIADLGVDLDGDATGGHAVVVESSVAPEELAGTVDGLRGNFEHYDSHVRTDTVARGEGSAVVSVWTTERAADTAAGFLGDLPEVVEQAVGPVDAADSGHAGPPRGGDTDGRGGASGASDAQGDHPHGADGRDDASDSVAGPDATIREELAEAGVYAGRPRDGDVHALVLYSEAGPDALVEAVADLRERFEHYDSHVETAVYVADGGAAPARCAVASLWETADAADTAGEFLTDLPGVVGRAGREDGFGTMGMFYTVKPDHRGEFVERFDDVGTLLEGMDGHRETALFENVDDENDMLIASQWDAREDALDFFSSEAFRDTVEWGREVLADRPRHVFLR
jgi:chlorite dismutase